MNLVKQKHEKQAADRELLRSCQETEQPKPLMQEERDKEPKLGNAWVDINGETLPVLLSSREPKPY